MHDLALCTHVGVFRLLDLVPEVAISTQSGPASLARFFSLESTASDGTVSKSVAVPVTHRVAYRLERFLLEMIDNQRAPDAGEAKRRRVHHAHCDRRTVRQIDRHFCLRLFKSSGLSVCASRFRCNRARDVWTVGGKSICLTRTPTLHCYRQEQHHARFE